MNQSNRQHRIDEVLLKITLRFSYHFKESQGKTLEGGEASFFHLRKTRDVAAKKSRHDHLTVHLLPWVACNMQGMFGIQAAPHWPRAGVQQSWMQFARPNRGSWCTGNGWDCRLLLVNPALQSQLSRAPWVAYLWLRRADMHACTHTHTFFIICTENVKINVKATIRTL